LQKKRKSLMKKFKEKWTRLMGATYIEMDDGMVCGLLGMYNFCY